MDDQTRVTTTTVVDPPPADADSDGVLPEPGRDRAAPLWYALVGTLCAILVAFAGTFVFLAVTQSREGAIDSAALVGLFGLVLAALLDIYRKRRG